MRGIAMCGLKAASLRWSRAARRAEYVIFNKGDAGKEWKAVSEP